MPNMTPKKTPMPSQDPKVRAHNFLEVSQGYTAEMAQNEAARCLNCKHRPCVSGCPVHIQIPDFIAQVAKGDYAAAYDIIADARILPAVCGRVCPQESQCERSACAASRASLSASAGWSALSPIGTTRSPNGRSSVPRQTAER